LTSTSPRSCASLQPVGKPLPRAKMNRNHAHYRLLGKPQISPAPREFLAHTDFSHRLLEKERGALAMPTRGSSTPRSTPRLLAPPPQRPSATRRASHWIGANPRGETPKPRMPLGARRSPYRALRPIVPLMTPKQFNAPSTSSVSPSEEPRAFWVSTNEPCASGSLATPESQRPSPSCCG
jgi:hypothetical protein